MNFNDAAYIVHGVELEGPDWEQQQQCEERRFAEEEERMHAFLAKIDACRLAVEEAMAELKRFEAVFGNKAPRNGGAIHGGNRHELHL